MNQIINLNEFKKEDLTFSKIDTTNPKCQRQNLAFPRYGISGDNVIFQTPEIKLTQYGIPQSGGDYYKSDESRSFIKIPLDPSQNELVEFIHKIDNAVLNNKKTTFGKREKKYTNHVKSFREPHELTDDDTRMNYFKVKLDTNYSTGAITTLLFLKDKNKIKQIPIKSLSDLEKYITWNSTIRMLLKINKLWSSKEKDVDGNLSFGITFKVLQIEVQPGVGNSSSNVEYAFV